MYECGVYKEEPEVRLVVKAGATLPTELGHRDWQLPGPCDASPETAAEVDRRGFHFFKTDEPHPHPETLRNAEASGN